MSINDYSELPEDFKKRIEKAKQIAQEGKSGCKRKVAHYILSAMNLTKDENNSFQLPYISDRKLVMWSGIKRSNFVKARQGVIKSRSKRDVNSERGCVYILTNPSMPGLIKIGKTTGTAQERANELYTTGVPNPFSVEYSILSNDPDTLEFLLHRKFGNHRVTKDREFFSCSTDEVLEWLKDKDFRRFLKAGGIL